MQLERIRLNLTNVQFIQIKSVQIKSIPIQFQFNSIQQLSEEEAEGDWQRGLNYKQLPPNILDSKEVDLAKVPAMMESSLFSGITHTEQIDDINLGYTEVETSGWAFTGGGRSVVRVDVSGDGGKTWSQAELGEGSEQPTGRAWGWVFWTTIVKAKIGDDVSRKRAADGVNGVDLKKTVTIVSKAVDSSFNVQPENVESIWNVRGLANNSWYRRTMEVVNEMDEEECLVVDTTNDRLKKQIT